MATQIVMDRAGDTRHNFDAKNADALLKAEEAKNIESWATFWTASEESADRNWPEVKGHLPKRLHS
jgi:hypothetical protein